MTTRETLIDARLSEAAIDFAELAAENAEKTDQLIRAYLLDRDWCQDRVAFLRALEAANPELESEHRHDAPASDSTGRVGQPSGDLPMSADDLVAVVCDPDRLWETHLALTEVEPDETTKPDRPVTAPSASDTRVGSETKGESWTRLIQNWPLFKQRVIPWLPALLAHAGLTDSDVADRFLAFIEPRRSGVQPAVGARLSDVWSKWLIEFARQELGREISVPPFNPQTFVPQAIRLALAHEGPFRSDQREPAWVSRFREKALSEVARLKSPNQLLSVTLPEVSTMALADYRRRLVEQIESESRTAFNELLA